MLRWLLILVCLTAAPPAAANMFTRGQQLYRAGEYASARDIWMPLAENGDAEAQYSIGVLYKRGESVAKDVLSAAKWFARAAAQGYVPAVTALRALAPELQEMLKAKHEAEGKDKMMKKEAGPPPPKQKPARQASLRDPAGEARELLAQLAALAPDRR